MPLPPYIRRNSNDEYAADDRERYQTCYADPHALGSVAAPTAGLHFTPHLLEALKANGISYSFVTLHVGAGTFLPVKAEDIRSHRMHEERYVISKGALSQWLDTKKAGAPLIAVGTTSLRSIESLGRLCNYDADAAFAHVDQEQRTALFIHPSGSQLFKPWLIDGLFTNFHQPRIFTSDVSCSNLWPRVYSGVVSRCD